MSIHSVMLKWIKKVSGRDLFPVVLSTYVGLISRDFFRDFPREFMKSGLIPHAFELNLNGFYLYVIETSI